MISKEIQFTSQPPPTATDKSEQPPAPIIEPTDNAHDVYVYCFENPLYDNINIIGVDLPCRYLDTSFDGHKYIYAMYDPITNYINAEDLKSRKGGASLQGFKECYRVFTFT